MSLDIASAIVQAQLEAYNAKDLEALLETYAADAKLFELHGKCTAQGRLELRARFAVRLAEPDLHARLLTRTVLGNVVVDYELVTRTFPEGVGTVEMLCIYEVLNRHIQKATFAVGEKRIARSSGNWRALMQLREQLGPLPPDFLVNREQGIAQRDPFKGWTK